MPDKPGAPPRAWQRMLSGRRLDLLDPSPLDVEIADIAHGLARVPRWNGQTKGDHAFSVAQHSLLVEAIACGAFGVSGPRDRLATLLHDAPEYVVGDLISPFKAVIGGDYKAVEERLLAAVHLRFGLPARRAASLTARIKKADQVAAWLEATRLAGFSDKEAARYFGRPKVATTAYAALIEPWPTVRAERAYLERFEALHTGF
jgi:uncharacterized protein